MKHSDDNPRRRGDRANPVARNLERFNRPATHADRKKAVKRGYRKHRGDQARGGSES